MIIGTLIVDGRVVAVGTVKRTLRGTLPTYYYYC